MIGSILYVVSFVLLTVLLFLYPKGERKMNAVTGILTAVMTNLCYGAVISQILSIAGLPVQLVSMGCVYLVSAALLAFGIYKKRSVQKVFLEKKDIISVAFLSFIFILVELKTFSYEMRPSFLNVMDSGNHFAMAMKAVRQQKVSGMSFAPFHNAMMIETFQPFLEQAKYYKAFVLADSLHYYMELLFFYGIVREFTKRRITGYLAPFLALLYWFGYPLFSYIRGNYVYWGWGVMICGFIAFVLAQFIAGNWKKTVSAFCLVIGCISLAICYSLFAPAAYAAVFLCFIFYRKERNIKISRRAIPVIAGGAVVAAVFAAYFYYSYFYKSGLTILSSLQISGSSYSDFYSNFMLVLPAVALFAAYCFRNKIKDTYLVCLLCLCAFSAVLLAGVFGGLIDKYYYYKMYYPVWFFWWIAAAKCVDSVPVQKESLPFVKAYFLMLAVAYIMCFGDIEERMEAVFPGITGAKGNMGTDLYSYNIATLKQDFEDFKYSTEKQEINRFVIENLKSEGESVPFVGWWDCRGEANWYNAVVGETKNTFLTNKIIDSNDDEWKSVIENGKFDYFAALKTSELYQENMDYFNRFEKVFENEEGFVARVR